MGNGIAFCTTLAGCVGCVGSCGLLGHFRLVSRTTARKLLHTGTGLVFLICWTLYDNTSSAKWLCAGVPALATLHFFLVGVGVVHDPLVIAGSTRTGERSELLKGPLIYGLVHTLLTVAFWRNSPTGIAAICLLCAGDGLADMVGRNYGKSRLPWNKEKSWAGSTACMIGGFTAAASYTMLFRIQGFLPPDLGTATILWKTLLVSLCGAAVEALPIREYDNLTVTFSSVMAAFYLFDC